MPAPRRAGRSARAAADSPSREESNSSISASRSPSRARCSLAQPPGLLVERGRAASPTGAPTLVWPLRSSGSSAPLRSPGAVRTRLPRGSGGRSRRARARVLLGISQTFEVSLALLATGASRREMTPSAPDLSASEDTAPRRRTARSRLDPGDAQLAQNRHAARRQLGAAGVPAPAPQGAAQGLPLAWHRRPQLAEQRAKRLPQPVLLLEDGVGEGDLAHRPRPGAGSAGGGSRLRPAPSAPRRRGDRPGRRARSRRPDPRHSVERGVVGQRQPPGPGASQGLDLLERAAPAGDQGRPRRRTGPVPPRQPARPARRDASAESTRTESPLETSSAMIAAAEPLRRTTSRSKRACARRRRPAPPRGSAAFRIESPPPLRPRRSRSDARGGGHGAPALAQPVHLAQHQPGLDRAVPLVDLEPHRGVDRLILANRDRGPSEGDRQRPVDPAVQVEARVLSVSHATDVADPGRRAPGG